MKHLKPFQLIILISIFIGFISCSSALKFPGISVPIGNQMTIELDGTQMTSENISAMISEKDGNRGLVIRTNFRSGQTTKRVNVYFDMKSEDLQVKDYKYVNGCLGNSICGHVTYYDNFVDVSPDNTFTTELNGGQALFKITDLDLKKGGYVGGYFAAGLANGSVKGKALNNGRFRVQITESLTN